VRRLTGRIRKKLLDRINSPQVTVSYLSGCRTNSL